MDPSQEQSRDRSRFGTLRRHAEQHLEDAHPTNA